MNLRTVLLKSGTIGAGHTVNFLVNNWFDYIVYIPVIAFLGPFWGCGAMILLSMALNLTLIWVYDKTGKDWLGFELMKEGKTSASLPDWLRKIIAFGDIPAYIGLALYDPFLAVIYLRKKESAFKGLSARDWKIFLSATILSNVGWTGFVYSGILVFKLFL